MMERQRAPKRDAAPDEVRCCCGRLVARRVSGGIELQCGRCKARMFIALTPDGLPLSPVMTAGPQRRAGLSCSGPAAAAAAAPGRPSR